MSWIMDFIKESNELSLAKKWRNVSEKEEKNKVAFTIAIKLGYFRFVEYHNTNKVFLIQ